MATLPVDNKLRPDQGASQDMSGGGAQNASTGAAPSGGASGALQGNTGVSTAGVGAGGQGWTNLQSYLNANQGSTGTSDYLKNAGGNAFNADQAGLDKGASDAKSQANSQVTGNQVGKDQASSLIQQSAQSGDAGQKAASQLQGNLSAQYAGPKTFDYGLSADTQKYGTGVSGDQNAWNGLLNSTYNQSAGGAMGGGMRALQTQLDTNNPALAQTRANLMSQYAGLGANRDKTVGDTNTALGNAQAQFNSDRSNLGTGLRNQFNAEVGNSQRANGTPGGESNQDAWTKAMGLSKILNTPMDPSLTGPYQAPVNPDLRPEFQPQLPARDVNNGNTQLGSHDPNYAWNHPGMGKPLTIFNK